jgi:hypothetical protein
MMEAIIAIMPTDSDIRKDVEGAINPIAEMVR